jgi:DNA-binding MarR family transcriptional regulator
MPVDLRTHDPDDGFDIAPGTNKARVLKLLYTNLNLGYKPAEIRDELEIPSGSVTTTLLRLHEEGHVGKTADGYYHAIESRDDLRRFAIGLV